MLACEADRPTVVKLLLSRGADANAVNKHGVTALMFAARTVDGLDCVSQLLDAGARIDVTDEDQNAAIAHAAAQGNLAVVRLLCDRDANFNVQNKAGATPLMAATYYVHADVVAYLLQRGADTTRRNKDGSRAVDIAAAVGSLESLRQLLMQEEGK